jgi:hypothetical protein
MAFLPLSLAAAGCDAGDMNAIKHRSSGPGAPRQGGLMHGLIRAAKAVASVLAECHRAQRHLAELRLHPDRYALDGDVPPDTYAEFLFRSPGTVWREPPARERGRRRPRSALG